VGSIATPSPRSSGNTLSNSSTSPRPADYYAAKVTNDRHMQEQDDAAYGMANTRVGPFQLQGGVRWERTVTESREVNPRSATETKTAGFPVDTTDARRRSPESIISSFPSLAKFAAAPTIIFSQA